MATDSLHRRVNEHSVAGDRDPRGRPRGVRAPVHGEPPLHPASIRKRGSSGGHHQAMELEDRFGHWRSEEVGDLIWGLGAMAAEQRVMERFQRIGYQIMNRSGGGVLDQNPFAATLSDREKRPLVAALLGQAFVVAYQTVAQNREGTDYVAERLRAAGELYGEEVTTLLDDARLKKPEIDVLDEATWPAI